MRRCFTFLELVGLVFVLGLFVAIFAPFIFHGHSHEKARRAACAGNLKQIGLAGFVYAADYDGAFPLTPEGNDFSILDENHTNILPNGKVYSCPSERNYPDLAANSDYWYVGSGVRDDAEDAERVMLAYDAFGNHPGNGWVNVIHANGQLRAGKPNSKTGEFDNRHAVKPEERP